MGKTVFYFQLDTTSDKDRIYKLKQKETKATI